MRRTLIVVIIIAAMVAAFAPLGGTSILSDLLWGRHRDYVTPGITYGIDEYFPKDWEKNTDLMFRYHKETDKVFAGTVLKIGVLITSKSAEDDKFAICVTDCDRMISDTSGKLNFDLKGKKDQIGGMQILGTFRGKYGQVELDTYRMQPGTRYLWSFVLRKGKYQAFNEQPLALYIAPPLGEVIERLRDASNETLKSWGLEALQTAEKVLGRTDETPCKYDICFADGTKMRDVVIGGRARVGKILGVFSQTALEGIIKVDEIDGKTIRSSTKGDFVRAFCKKEDELTVAWVVRVRKYADSSPRRKLTEEQMRNLATFPEEIRGMMCEMATTSDGAIAKSDGTVIMTDSVTHLKEPFHRNTSGMYQLAYQVWTSQHSHYVPAPQEAYMPESYVKYVRVIKLTGSGTVSGFIDEAEIKTTDRPGLFGGIAYMIGQALHRPDRVNVKASAPTKIDIENNNSNANTNTNINPNTINVGDGSATNTTTGDGYSNAESGNQEDGYAPN